ncbi:hypothetical protein J7E71_23045 [Mesobacillus foraminis]|uniref:hypothetical protein n=1 Tax=Mesobacillus foraminis TaxID=279826 RepID=UPI001BE8A7A5|nr:hypothetical protein [Mesobacillus foraminis]MBT2758753.1 hypothetical protein [Mesobacillus foraminis]
MKKKLISFAFVLGLLGLAYFGFSGSNLAGGGLKDLPTQHGIKLADLPTQHGIKLADLPTQHGIKLADLPTQHGIKLADLPTQHSPGINKA